MIYYFYKMILMFVCDHWLRGFQCLRGVSFLSELSAVSLSLGMLNISEARRIVCAGLGVREAAETAAWWTCVGRWCWHWRWWLLHGWSQSMCILSLFGIHCSPWKCDTFIFVKISNNLNIFNNFHNNIINTRYRYGARNTTENSSIFVLIQMC